MSPENLYEEVIEVEERLVLRREDCQLKKHMGTVTGVTGELVHCCLSLRDGGYCSSFNVCFILVEI